MSSPQGNIAFKTLTRPDPSLDFQVLFCPRCNLGPGFTRFLTRCSNAFTIPLRPFCLCRIPSLPHFSNTSVYPAWLTLKTFSPRCLLWSFSFQHPPPSSFPLHPPAHAYPSGCALLQDTACPIVADVIWLPYLTRSPGVGGSVVGTAVQQSPVEFCLTLSSLRIAKLSIWLFVLGHVPL